MFAIIHDSVTLPLRRWNLTLGTGEETLVQIDIVVVIPTSNVNMQATMKSWKRKIRLCATPNACIAISQTCPKL